ncbi:MAG: autotransporter [Collimonas pratensis]|uniref:beta strand repeat-containing protein n=1 Tax=Collimonas pratensis TaxID=279113 RepID=UPI003C72930E
MPTPHFLTRNYLAALIVSLAAAGCGGGDGGTTSGTTGSNASATTTVVDITAAILANQNIALSTDSVINLPAGVTTYTGVISGQGTLLLNPAAGSSHPSTFVLTRASTFMLPDSRQVETVTKTVYPGMGYALSITGSNPPALTINPGVTLQIGSNTSADNSPNIIATSDSKNPASVVNGEINLDNILNNGAIVLNSAQFILLGQVSGTGSISQLPNVWGGNSMGGVNPFSGVLALSAGQDFGTNHVSPSIPNAKAVVNEGSWLVWSAPNSVVTVTQNIYEASFGGDINFHPIGNSRIIMRGVYSHTDNSPHGSANLVNPGLSDASLNLAKVIYRGGPNDANGNDGSYRGINIESSGTVQWGDGTTHDFFLPSAPSPFAVSPALGAKNTYINLHRGGTLALNYNGPVSLNVGITGGGGGPDRDGSTGTGNVTIMPTTGNDVTFSQPQNYNGITTIGAKAILRLGAGSPQPLNYDKLVYNSSTQQYVKSTTLQATYNGDSSLLTAESASGASTDSIVNDGSLIVQNTTDAITLSNISGTGTFLQNGTASTTLRNNSFSGAAIINSGSVLAASANAFGSGNLTNNAGLGLGSTLFELTLAGSYQQTASGSLTLPINGTSKGVNYGHLTVAGPVVLGGVLALNFSGTFTSGQKFTLIDAGGGITGSFSNVTSSGPAVDITLNGGVLYATVR